MTAARRGRGIRLTFMDDGDLSNSLTRLSTVPYPGQWLSPPFAEHRLDDRRFALVARDAGLSAIGVDRSDGTVWFLPEDDEPGLVNSSIDALISCSAAYAAAAAEAAALEAAGLSGHEPGEDEDPGDAH